MKNKKLLVPTLLLSIILNGSYIPMGNIKEVKANSVSTEIKNSKLVNTSVGSATTEHDFRFTAEANFINDKNSSDATAIITLNGFIPSGRKILYLNPYRGVMQWPVSYQIEVENISDNSVKIVDNIPKNTIETKDVNESVSYSIGGGVNTSKTGSLNTNVAYSKSVKYTQPDYITVQTEGTNNKVVWNTKFAETRDQYNLDSWNIIYGNEMFMRTRYSGTSVSNFKSDHELSSLITGGFSPNVGLVLTAPKDATVSRLKFKFKRETLSYHMVWYTAWSGINYLDRTVEDVVEFELDWVNKTIKQVN